MVYNYVVTLRNQQTGTLDVLGILLSLLSVFFFTRELLFSREVSFAYPLGILFILGVLAWNIYVQKRRRIKVYYSRALLIAALVWMKMPFFQWLSFVFIMLALLEYQAKYSVEIGFSDREIVFNRLFRKKYRWNEFSNIVLKDGLLTMDFRNNRILQREVEDDDDYDAEEEEFNQYCRSRLAATS